MPKNGVPAAGASGSGGTAEPAERPVAAAAASACFLAVETSEQGRAETRKPVRKKKAPTESREVRRKGRHGYDHHASSQGKEGHR